MIKKCTRCGEMKPHHHELDHLCMQCEMEVCYLDADETTKSLIKQLEYLDESDHHITKLHESISDFIKTSKRILDNPIAKFLDKIFG